MLKNSMGAPFAMSTAAQGRGDVQWQRRCSVPDALFSCDFVVEPVSLSSPGGALDSNSFSAEAGRQAFANRTGIPSRAACVCCFYKPMLHPTHHFLLGPFSFIQLGKSDVLVTDLGLGFPRGLPSCGVGCGCGSPGSA